MLKFSKMMFCFCLLSSSWSLASLSPFSIIFDLNGVLALTDKTVMTQIVGYRLLIRYIIKFKQNPYYSLVRILDAIKPLDGSYFPVHDPAGNQLPALMIDWMTNKKSGPEILHTLEQAIAQYPELIRHPIEKEVVLKLARALFTPQLFAQAQYLHPHALNLIKKCKKRGYRIFILSNWDSASFAFFKEKNKEFFDLFDDIIISGNIGYTKPDPACYNQLLAKHNLKAAECIFIDDQPINIVTAQHLGIQTILCSNQTRSLKNPLSLVVTPKPLLTLVWKEIKQRAAHQKISPSTSASSVII